MNRKDRRAKKLKAAPDPRLDRAMALHQDGRLMEADALYRQVLGDTPTHPDALRLRGALAYQIGNPPAAAELLAEARRADPKNPEILSLLGMALEASGNPEGAEQAYRAGLKLAPQSTALWNNLGVLLREAGRPDEAIDAFKTGLSHSPQDIDTLQNLAVALFHAGRLDASLSYFEEVAGLVPGDPEILLNHGVVLTAANRLDEAVAYFKDALTALPNDPDILTSLSAAYLRQERLEAAEDTARKAVTAAPQSPGALANLGVVLTARRAFSEAEASYAEALRQKPDYADVWSNLGNMLVAANRAPEAAVAYNKAIKHAPQDARHRFQAGLCALSQGELEAGWRGYEDGLLCGERVLPYHPGHPRWTGEAIPGKTLLIVPEQGLGDEIRTLTLLPDVLTTSQADVVFACDARLIPLVNRSFPTMSVIPREEVYRQSCDLWCPMGSLPGLVRASMEDFPASSVALVPDQERVAAVEAVLPPKPAGGKRIGFAWRSGLSRLKTQTAVTESADWQALFDVPTVQLVNLQYGEIGDELDDTPVYILPDLDLKNDLEAAAALTACCDLVINMGNSVGDLAGALGVPCFSLMLRADPIALGTEGHPFYPETKVYWRESDEDWLAVIGRVVGDLRNS